MHGRSNITVLFQLFKRLFSPTIVDRPSNDYETVGNIKVVSADSFKQLEVSKKVDYATKLPVLTQGSFYFIKQRS